MSWLPWLAVGYLLGSPDKPQFVLVCTECRQTIRPKGYIRNIFSDCMCEVPK